MRKSHAIFLALIIFLVSIAIFIARVVEIMEDGSRKDLHIFIAHAHHYLETGELYARSDDLSIWQPSGGIYKFPPAYQWMIVPLLQAGMSDKALIKTTAAGLVIIYLAALAFFGRLVIKQGLSLSTSIVICSSLLWMTPFFSAFRELAAEILVFFLLSLFFYLYMKNRWANCGVLLAMAVHIKIYPVFLLLYFLLVRRWKVIAGFMSGFLVIAILSILYFGMDENLYYFKTILPVLLTEEHYHHFQNLTLEFWLLNHQIISNMNGATHGVIRAILLIAIVAIAASDKQRTPQKQLLCLGTLCAGILVWITNYWPQYQILLLIPFTLLCSEAILHRKIWLMFILGITGISLVLSHEGLMTLLQYQIARGAIDQAALSALGDSIPISAALFEVSLAGWIYYWLLQLNVFLPHILFVAGFTVLMQDWYFQYRHPPASPSR